MCFWQVWRCFSKQICRCDQIQLRQELAHGVRPVCFCQEKAPCLQRQGAQGVTPRHRTAFGLDPRRRRPAGRRLALRTAQCGLGAGIASHSSGGSLEQAGPPLVSGQADATASTAPHPACPVVSPSATTSPWPRNRTTSTAAASARPRRSETSSSPLPRPAPHCSKKGLGRVPRATALASSVSQHVFRNWAFRGRFKTQPRAQKQLRKKQRPTLTAGSLAGSWKDFARW